MHIAESSSSCVFSLPPTLQTVACLVPVVHSDSPFMHVITNRSVTSLRSWLGLTYTFSSFSSFFFYFPLVTPFPPWPTFSPRLLPFVLCFSCQTREQRGRRLLIILKTRGLLPPPSYLSSFTSTLWWPTPLFFCAPVSQEQDSILHFHWAQSASPQ